MRWRGFRREFAFYVESIDFVCVCVCVCVCMGGLLNGGMGELGKDIGKEDSSK